MVVEVALFSETVGAAAWFAQKSFEMGEYGPMMVFDPVTAAIFT
jgi:hypothetical protein